MLKASRETWDIWMRAGFAAYWGPEDVPVLRMVIQLYDMVERGAASASLRAEFRQLADNYGITPKGRQDRRWTRPVGDQAVAPAAETKPSRYAHLRTVTPA